MFSSEKIKNISTSEINKESLSHSCLPCSMKSIREQKKKFFLDYL